MKKLCYFSVRRRLFRRRHHPMQPQCSGLLLTVMIGVALSAAVISLLEVRLRPVVKELAVVQVNNRVTSDVNAALNGLEVDYGSIVDIQQDAQGSVLAITSDMAEVNRIRTHVSDCVLAAVSGIDAHDIGIPLGSLFDLDLAWAKGPALRVHSLVAGTVQTQVHSEFTTAGINQTRHRILLDVTVPLTVLLPGITVDTQVSTVLCVAETVIVGRVPNTYFSPNSAKTLFGGMEDQ